MKDFTVSIVIPNYNGKNLLEKHLKQVIIAAGKAEIIVVDDHSDDGSAEYLQAEYPNVKLVKQPEHTGFAGTVNTGVRNAGGEIVVLLNTDVEPAAGFLKPLLTHFQNDRIFAAGCLDKSYDKTGITERGRGIGSWIKGFYIHKKGEVDKSDTAWVSGGSGAFRKSLWDKLGGMDEIYSPFYWEDIDLSYRARKAGYQVVFESASMVHHYHESGAVKIFYSPKTISTIAYRNQLLFIWKNLTDLKIWIAHLVWLPIRIIQSLFAGKVEFLLGFFWALSLTPKLMGRKPGKVKFIISDKIL
jgi:GT2 family glycosyltransferase